MAHFIVSLCMINKRENIPFLTAPRVTVHVFIQSVSRYNTDAIYCDSFKTLFEHDDW